MHKSKVLTKIKTNPKDKDKEISNLFFSSAPYSPLKNRCLSVNKKLILNKTHFVSSKKTENDKQLNTYNAHQFKFFYLIRPLLSITRLDTLSICAGLKLPIYPDKSNIKTYFLRNRVRKQLLPAIRVLLNPQFDEMLCNFSDSMNFYTSKL